MLLAASTFPSISAGTGCSVRERTAQSFINNNICSSNQHLHKQKHSECVLGHFQGLRSWQGQRGMPSTTACSPSHPVVPAPGVLAEGCCSYGITLLQSWGALQASRSKQGQRTSLSLHHFPPSAKGKRPIKLLHRIGAKRRTCLSLQTPGFLLPALGSPAAHGGCLVPGS